MAEYTLIADATRKKVASFLRERVKTTVERDGRLFVARGSAVVYLDVEPFGATEAVVRLLCAVVSGASPTEHVLRSLMQANADATFGSFGLKDDCIVLRHTMIGSTLNREELWAAVEALATAADAWDDRIRRETGGELSLTLHQRRQDPPAGAAVRGGLSTWLVERGIHVTDIPGDGPEDAVLDRLGHRAGTGCNHLAELQRLLRRACEAGWTEVRMTLASKPAAEVDAIVGYAKLLQTAALVRRATYRKQDRRLTLGLDPGHAVLRRFAAGQWLERFAKVVAREALAGREGEVRCNVTGRAPDGGDVEFDLLVRSGSEVVWVECKTGAYQDGLLRYRELGDVLGLSPTHRLVLMAVPPSDLPVADLGDLYRLTIVTPERFRDSLAQLLV